MDFYYSLVGILCFTIVYLLFTIRNLKLMFSTSLYERKQRQSCILEFEKYMIALRIFQEKAYEIVYKDDVLIYSLEGVKLNEEQFNKIAIKFLKLVLKLLGPNLVQEYIYFYGSEESFYLNLTEFFNTRYDEDEIRKSSVEEMINSETPDEEPK